MRTAEVQSASLVDARRRSRRRQQRHQDDRVTRLRPHPARVRHRRTARPLDRQDRSVDRSDRSPDGQLGLWIGVSVITLVEVLQLVALVVRVITARRRRRLRPKNRSHSVTVDAL